MSFGNLELRHYDSKPISFDRSRVYMKPELADELGQYAFAHSNGKPRGIWLSVKGQYDWPEWCNDNEFYLEEIATEHRVTLWPTANILRISNHVELDDFHEKYRIPNPVYDRLEKDDEDHQADYPWRPYKRRYDNIDWGAVAAEYDGIIITPYLWNRRLEGPMWYYGWDAASGCIWNLQAVRKIEWMIPELEELKRKMARWIDVAVEQANNRMLYGTDNPGGRGRQQYPINSPFFPSAEQDEKGLAPWTTTTTSTE